MVSFPILFHLRSSIADADQEVSKVLPAVSASVTRGNYTKLTPKQQAAIGNYTVLTKHMANDGAVSNTETANGSLGFPSSHWHIKFLPTTGIQTSL